jgi:hypothetical protein
VVITLPGNDDLANVELAGSELDPGMRYEHGRRAQVPSTRRTEHREKIRKTFSAGDRNRLDSSGLPSRQQRSCVGVGLRAAIAFQVFD